MKLENAIAYLQPIIADGENRKNYNNVITAINIVTEAAKKQIPREPVKEYSVGIRHLYRCRCGEKIIHTDGQFETNTCFRYCPGCGQRLKWPEKK